MCNLSNKKNQTIKIFHIKSSFQSLSVAFTSFFNNASISLMKKTHIAKHFINIVHNIHYSDFLYSQTKPTQVKVRKSLSIPPQQCLLSTRAEWKQTLRKFSSFHHVWWWCLACLVVWFHLNAHLHFICCLFDISWRRKMVNVVVNSGVMREAMDNHIIMELMSHRWMSSWNMRDNFQVTSREKGGANLIGLRMEVILIRLTNMIKLLCENFCRKS